MTPQEMLKQLKLSYLYNNYEEYNKEAKELKFDNEKYLNTMLEREIAQRKNNSISKSIRDAKYPIKKYLEDFDRTKYSIEIQNELDKIENLNFINNNENIILIGNPGCGKTHLAISLGIKACMEGKSVLFSSVPNLIIELKEAMSMNNLTGFKKKFESVDLVILDELGYISFDKNSCDLLFNLLSNRANKGSIIITTNLTFDKWIELFKDEMLTSALIDRLAYKAYILNLSTEVSHRLEETEEWKNNN